METEEARNRGCKANAQLISACHEMRDALERARALLATELQLLADTAGTIADRRTAFDDDDHTLVQRSLDEQREQIEEVILEIDAALTKARGGGDAAA